jgi:hypothetical protein
MILTSIETCKSWFYLMPPNRKDPLIFLFPFKMVFHFLAWLFGIWFLLRFLRFPQKEN